MARTRVVWMAATLVCIATVANAQVAIKGKPDRVPGQVVIKYRDAAPGALVVSHLKSVGLIDIDTSKVAPFLRAKVAPGENFERVLQACQSQPNVEYVEPNFYVYALETPPVLPNDPRFGDLWGLNQSNNHDINAPEAWAITTGSSNVLVGIIDTGIDYDHEDLKDNIWYNPGESGNKSNNGVDDDNNGYVDDFRGWNFIFETKDPYDDQGHGTHVAGTVGAVGNNGKGVAGVNWSVKLMALKFLDREGSGTTADAAEAIIYAVNNGAKILSNSWGGGERSQALQDAIQYAHDHGVLFIVAAGNDSRNNDRTATYPSSFEVPNVLSVASSDRNDKLSSFSNYGRRTVDIAAPGSDILSTQPLSRYQRLSGTSMATPHVSGVCALVWAKYPSLTPHQVMMRVLGAADPVAAFAFQMTTGGRLNAERALGTSPLIAFTTDWSNVLDVNGPYPVSTAVTDDGQVTSVRLVYTLNNAGGDTLDMAAGENDTFTANIPGQPQNTEIRYTVIARDNDGNLSSSQTYMFEITSEPDDRDGNGCCGSSALSFNGADTTTKLALEIPVNVVFFLLPIMLLRRRRTR